MFVERLKLIGFRNYESLNIEFSNNFNIIYGDNGQGKTNILEAVFLCSSGRSHRTSKDIDLIRFSSPGYYIKLDFEKETNKTFIEIFYDKVEKKRIKINGLPIQKIGNLMGQFNAVIFSPEDLLIIKEGPSERRRFIDITLSQLKPTYFYDLQQYMKVLLQRNILLKDIQNNKNLIDTLEIWNNNLVNIGSRIIKNRYEFIKKLGIYAEANHYKLTDGKEKLILKYSPSINVKGYDGIEKIQDAFNNALNYHKKSELLKGTTMVGPQRDDYEMFLDETNLKLFGSQGQQRTAILSIKMSEIDIMKEDTGEYPVLLLDDVMSELDTKRQEYLLNNLKNIQTFITCTDKDFFRYKENEQVKFFKVTKGEISKNNA